MAVKVALADRLRVKLRKLGFPERKAKTLAQGLAPTAARQRVTGTVTGKLETKLQTLGLSKRKATELAKALAPLVRASIKAKVKAKQMKLDDVDDVMVEGVITEVTDESTDEALDRVAPKVNGHRVRLDLPVVRRGIWQHAPVKGIELLRVMDGLTTNATYLVAAVRSDEGILAVRQLGGNLYNVKFYPHMGYWGKTQEELASLGATEYLAREWYQRMHMDRSTLDQFLGRLEAESKPKARIKALIDRFRTVAAGPLLKAFGFLHKRIGVAA